MQIFVRTATGKVITIDCDGPTEKIFGVKEKVLDRTGLAVSAQALLFAGKALLDEDTLGAKGIVAETTLFLVEKIEKEALPSWGCRVCGTLNQGEASECEICCEPAPVCVQTKPATLEQKTSCGGGSAASSPSWTCSLCGFESPATSTECDMCSRPREEEESARSQLPAVDCANCGERIGEGASTCELCGEARPS